MLNKHTNRISNVIVNIIKKEFGKRTLVPHANDMQVAAMLDTIRALLRPVSDIILFASSQSELLLDHCITWKLADEKNGFNMLFK